MTLKRLLILAAAIGCGGDDDTPVFDASVSDAAGPQVPHFRLDVPADPSAPIPIAGIPYPNNLLLGTNGKIFVTAATLPVDPASDPGGVTSLVEALSAQAGFGVTTGALFPVGGTTPADPVDVATLTDTTVTLVDLADDTTVPVSVHVREQDALVHVMPAWGNVLQQGHTYAYVLRAGIATKAGTALVADPDLTARLTDASELVHAPLRAWLTAGSIDPATVVGATVFTTSVYDPVLTMARAHLDTMAAPAAVVDRVYDTTQLDEFLGVPVDPTFPGLDNMGGVAHASLAYVILGRFQGPNFVNALPSKLGKWEFDATTGAPVQKGTHDLPFLLALPAGVTDYANIPVVVYQHTATYSRGAALAVANTLAARGWAVLATDMPMHGDRFANKKDMVHNFTGVMGGDGLADSESTFPLLYFFDVLGDAANGIRQMDPPIMTANLNQAAVDIMATVRFAKVGDVTAIAAVLPGGVLSFRTDRVPLIGDSFSLAASFMAATFDPSIDTLFAVAGSGGWMLPACENSPSYWPTFGMIYKGIYAIPDEAVEHTIDPPRTHWVFLTLQSLFEVGDPLTYAHRPLENFLWVTPFGEEVFPNQAQEHMAGAMGLEWAITNFSSVGPTHIVAQPTRAAPFTGNVSGGQVTAAFVQLSDGATLMLSDSISSHNFELPFPPFVDLPAPELRPNPIVELQAMMGDWMDSYLATGIPTVTDPF